MSGGASFTQTSGPPAAIQGGGGFVAGQAQYADVNGDGRDDLIYQGTDNQFWLALSNGTGFAQTSGPPAATHGGPGFMPGEAQYADVNGDGKADLIYQGVDNQFWLALSTGTGFDQSQPSALQHGGGFIAGEAQYGDVNGDGKADLVYQGLDNKIYVSLSNGTTLASSAQLVADYGGTFQPGMFHV